MPDQARSVSEKADVLRRLLGISGKEHDSYADLATEYLRVACDLLDAPEAALSNGGAQTWHWRHKTALLSSCQERDLAAGVTVIFDGADGARGRLLLPHCAPLCAVQGELAELVAFAAGQALDHFARNAQRIRRSVLEREREEVLQEFMSGGSIADALNSTAALVDRHAPNCKTALLAIDGWAVECVAAPGLPAAYKSASSALGALPPESPDETMGAVRSAAAVHDRARHIEIAGKLGLPWCESVPVLSRSGEMLGLFIAHCAEPPVRATREILRNASRVASLVMEHRRLQIRAEWLAAHDPLTGLGNSEELKRIIRTAVSAAPAGEGVAVLFISLDRFRQINGALGRTAGDLVIKRAAERIRAVLHDGDFAARSGGDEFVAMLIGRRDHEAVLAAAEEIRSVIAQPLQVEGNELALTCSIGASMWPDGGEDADSLLRDAELAMFRARDQGYGRIQEYAQGPSGDAKPSPFLVEQGLLKAVERNELELRFQPVVSMEGALNGFEVLLSWSHPEYGRIPANHFIPIAEEADLIIPIGEWVLRRVCSQALAWRAMRREPLSFWVNVSARQFGTPTFVDTVRSSVAELGSDASCIVLELTETAIIRNLEESARVMSELRDLGVRLAIDDFGTGYSSLNYLRTFPVQAIKIDQSFIRDLSDSSRAVAVMESIVGLGHTLGLEVVAEGVENQTQLGILRRVGCDLAQGYLFASPMPAPDAEAMIRDPACQ